MAEVKISELTSATTPLAGTETVPIVQGGVTKKVAISEIGGGGGAAWGGITGTLSSQTDLNSALSGKQETLVSGTSIKTIEGQSILGSGNIDLTKSDVGLSNVDNTSDLSKPISTATETALNAKQASLVSGTNIKTINGSSVLGSGDLVVGGGGGIHALIKPQSGMGVSAALTAQWTTNGFPDNQMVFYPFIPAQSFTSTSLSLWNSFGSAGATFRALIYSDLNGLPNTKLFESATIDGSTSGLKTITNTFNFLGGTTYWLCYHSGVSGAALASISSASTYSFAAKKANGYDAFVNSYYLDFALGSAPTTATIIQNQTYSQALPNININV